MTVAKLRETLAVQYLGSEPDRMGVLSPELVRRGVALFPGHPGRIWDTTVQHVQVIWVGLEEEPETFAVGSAPPTSTAPTPALRFERGSL